MLNKKEIRLVYNKNYIFLTRQADLFFRKGTLTPRKKCFRWERLPPLCSPSSPSRVFGLGSGKVHYEPNNTGQCSQVEYVSGALGACLPGSGGRSPPHEAGLLLLHRMTLLKFSQWLLNLDVLKGVECFLPQQEQTLRKSSP